MNETEWIYVATDYATGIGFDEFISSDGLWGLIRWFDGTEEIFEVSVDNQLKMCYNLIKIRKGDK